MDGWELLTKLIDLQNDNTPVREIVELAEQNKDLMDSRHAEVLLSSTIGDEPKISPGGLQANPEPLRALYRTL